ncbi:VanZ family protein [Cellulosilyticum ruminicola]|uniref:VanZ family protein n=1 Tax=Cellulosilyticum ruminicola TaxID=425254 RepID=UPI0038B8DEFE
MNFIPFTESVITNSHLDITEILYNILVFVPLGIYVSIFKPHWSFLNKAMPSLCLSLLLETLQFIFAIGASDITNIIGNTLGRICGILLFLCLKKLFKKKYLTIINCIGLSVESLAIILLSLLILYNQ